MKNRNALRTVLGAIGLVAWALYILACYPSWSPDGSKILFPYLDSETEEASIVLLDRKSGAMSKLFVAADNEVVTAQWTRDGTRAVIFHSLDVADTGDLLGILVRPIDAKEPVRYFALPENGSFPFFSWPEIDGDLFIGGKYLARLNLKTGETESQELESEITLVQGKNRILYNLLRQKSESGETEDVEGENEVSLEVGILDPASLTLEPLFKLEKAGLEKYGVEELTPFMAVDPTGSRIATFGQGEEKGFILLCNEAGLESVVEPDFPFQRYSLGNLQWAPDGRTIYAAVLSPTGDEGVMQYSIGEIPTDGGLPARAVPVLRLECDDCVWAVQTALSPDGGTVAVAAAFPGEAYHLEPEDQALYLVDLRDPDRKVTKIRPPRS